MSSETLYLTGEVYWAKLKKPDEKYNNFTIDFYPNEVSADKIKGSGLQVQEKEGESGRFFYKFRRPVSKIIKNELVKFGPPSVLDKENKPFEGIVGNGSEVTIKLTVFDTIKGKGHRLEAVRVERLVEYSPEDGEGFSNNSSFIPPFMDDVKTTKRNKPKEDPPF